jgi:hypothetical protein
VLYPFKWDNVGVSTRLPASIASSNPRLGPGTGVCAAEAGEYGAGDEEKGDYEQEPQD